MYDSFPKDYYRFVRKRRRSNCACYLIIISQFWPGVKSDSSTTLFKNNTYNLINKLISKISLSVCQFSMSWLCPLNYQMFLYLMHLLCNSFVLQLNVLKDQNLQLQLLHQEQPQPLRLQKAHVH